MWNNIQRYCVRYSDDPHPDLECLQRTIVKDGIDGPKDSPSPLHFSATGSYTIIAEYLLQQSADVNATDNNGATPLHWACAKGNLKMVKLLLKYKAKVNLLDDGMYIYIKIFVIVCLIIFCVFRWTECFTLFF